MPEVINGVLGKNKKEPKLKLLTAAYLQYSLMYEKIFKFNPNIETSYSEVTSKLNS